MDFDVVIGNPPYNNDLYLDFVQAGYEALKPNGVEVMITPAKGLNGKGGEKNELFRNNIGPHTETICFYPCAQEIFDIRNLDGIAYYVVYKDKTFEKKHIINKSSRVKLFNNEADREMYGQLNNAAYTVDKKIEALNKLQIAAADWTPFGVKSEAHSKNNTVGVKVSSTPNEVCVMSGDRIRGYCKKSDIVKNKDLVGKWMLISNGMNGNCYYTEDGQNLGMNKTYIIKPNEVACEPYVVIGVADTEDAIKSLDSYIWCKTTRFLALTGIVGQGTADTEMWRFVPDPGAFDHIFTDAELYQKYGLTQDEINIIESVIKERK